MKSKRKLDKNFGFSGELKKIWKTRNYESRKCFRDLGMVSKNITKNFEELEIRRNTDHIDNSSAKINSNTEESP